MKQLTLCADDFAWSRGTSETIAELLDSDRINATSAITLMPGWPEDSRLLAALQPPAQVGLHLTMTGERPLTAMRLLAPSGRLPDLRELQHRLRARSNVAAELTAEIDAQFDAFRAHMGRPPDFVDGHQHVHHHPVLRPLVLGATLRHAPRAWVRRCGDRPAAMLARPFAGKAIASAWHGRHFAAQARVHGLTHNASFAGHYDFAADLAAVLPDFLRGGSDGHLVMVHPGTGEVKGDPIADARVREAAALRRLDVGTLAADHGFRLG
jgi:chitin disaccharide deacetylase